MTYEMLERLAFYKENDKKVHKAILDIEFKEKNFSKNCCRKYRKQVKLWFNYARQGHFARVSK